MARGSWSKSGPESERPAARGALRVGVDLVSVERLRALAADPVFSRRAFHPSERAAAGAPESEHLAGVLAAKEAIAKALGVVPPPWEEMVLTSGPGRRPTVALSPALAARGEVLDLSIAHAVGLAVAVALVALHGFPGDAP